MPATEEVFRLRSCVVPIELKQPCRADGACPSASTGLGPTAKEGGDPISTPWSSGAMPYTQNTVAEKTLSQDGGHLVLRSEPVDSSEWE